MALGVWHIFKMSYGGYENGVPHNTITYSNSEKWVFSEKYPFESIIKYIVARFQHVDQRKIIRQKKYSILPKGLVLQAYKLSYIMY